MRQIKNSNELINLIASMKGGAKVSVGYVSSANMPKTTKNIDWNNLEANKNDFDSIPQQYNNILSLKDTKAKKFASIGIQGILKVTSFTTNWQTAANYSKNARNFEKAREDYMIDHGIDSEKIDARRRNGYTNTIDYGTNGILTNDRNDGTQSLSVMFNPNTNTNMTISYFLIDEKGDMSNPMGSQALSHFIKKKQSKEVMEDLFNELDNADELKQEYRYFCKAMKYNYRNYRMERILYIVGTIDGEPFFFLNDEFTDDIDGIHINPTVFKEIAYKKAEKLQLTMNDWMPTVEESNSSYLKSIIKETISNIINEKVISLRNNESKRQY